MFAPPLTIRQSADQPARGRVTVDADGTVLAFERPDDPHRAMRLSEREKLERALWARVEWAGLPLPVLQYRWALSEGRQYRSDGAYIEHRILLEVQGGIWARDPGRHNRGSGYERDCERLSLAAAMGWRAMYFTEGMIKSGEATRLIAKALGRDEAGGQLSLASTESQSEINGA